MRSWSSIEEPPALEVGGQLLQGEPHPPLHRAQRYPDHLRDLAVAVAPEVGQLHRLPLLGRQAAQRLPDQVALDRRGHLAPGVGAGPAGLRRGRDLPLLALVRAAAAQVVDRAVADRRDDPRAQRAAVGVEPRGAVPELEERVLDDVLRPAGVAEDPQRDRVRERAVAVVQQRQRIDLAGRQGLRQLEIAVSIHQLDRHANSYARRARLGQESRRRRRSSLASRPLALPPVAATTSRMSAPIACVLPARTSAIALGFPAVTRSTTSARTASSLSWARPRSRTISAGARPLACASSWTWRPWSRVIRPASTSPTSSASGPAGRTGWGLTIQLAVRTAGAPAAPPPPTRAG